MQPCGRLAVLGSARATALHLSSQAAFTRSCTSTRVTLKPLTREITNNATTQSRSHQSIQSTQQNKQSQRNTRTLQSTFSLAQSRLLHRFSTPAAALHSSAASLSSPSQSKHTESHAKPSESSAHESSHDDSSHTHPTPGAYVAPVTRLDADGNPEVWFFGPPGSKMTREEWFFVITFGSSLVWAAYCFYNMPQSSDALWAREELQHNRNWQPPALNPDPVD